MKRNEVIFLFAVAAFAVAFAALSIGNTRALIAVKLCGESVAGGVAGKAREVDMEKLQRLIQEQSLSNHEALFYKAMPIGFTPQEPGEAPQ